MGFSSRYNKPISIDARSSSIKKSSIYYRFNKPGFIPKAYGKPPSLNKSSIYYRFNKPGFTPKAYGKPLPPTPPFVRPKRPSLYTRKSPVDRVITPPPTPPFVRPKRPSLYTRKPSVDRVITPPPFVKYVSADAYHRLKFYQDFDSPSLTSTPLHIVQILEYPNPPGNRDRMAFFFYHVMNGLHSPKRTTSLMYSLWPIFRQREHRHMKQMTEQYYSHRNDPNKPLKLTYFDLQERRFLNTLEPHSYHISEARKDLYFNSVPFESYRIDHQ